MRLLLRIAEQVDGASTTEDLWRLIADAISGTERGVADSVAALSAGTTAEAPTLQCMYACWATLDERSA